VGRIVRLDHRRLPAVAGIGFKLKHYAEIHDIEHEVFAIDRVRCSHVAMCSEELLDRLLLRVRVARMRFGKTNPFELGHALVGHPQLVEHVATNLRGQVSRKRLHSTA